MKRGTPDHPKMLMLQARLGLPKYAAVGLLESLWQFTARYAPAGDIGKYPSLVIAQSIGWDRDPDQLIAALVETGWIDRDGEGQLVVHDWSEHADDFVHLQLARAGQYFADGTRPRVSRLSREERQAVEQRYADQEQKRPKAQTQDRPEDEAPEQPNEEPQQTQDEADVVEACVHDVATASTQKAPRVCIENARRVHGERTAEPSLAEPCLASAKPPLTPPPPVATAMRPPPNGDAGRPAGGGVLAGLLERVGLGSRKSAELARASPPITPAEVVAHWHEVVQDQRVKRAGAVLAKRLGDRDPPPKLTPRALRDAIRAGLVRRVSGVDVASGRVTFNAEGLFHDGRLIASTQALSRGEVELA